MQSAQLYGLRWGWQPSGLSTCLDFYSHFVHVRSVTRSIRTVGDRSRFPTSTRKKLTDMVEIPTVLDVGPFTEVGRLFKGKACALRPVSTRTAVASMFVRYIRRAISGRNLAV